MKALTCEMCGSTNLLKQDGVFVCQSCGTKYSVEEAKKMMVEGTVNVEGTVKIDKVEDANNFLQLAEAAIESANGDEAYEYVNRALEISPNNARAWLIKMKATAFLCSLADTKVLDILNAGKRAIELSDGEFSQEVYNFYLEVMLRTLQFFTTQLEQGLQEIQDLYHANCQVYLFNTSEITWNQDEIGNLIFNQIDSVVMYRDAVPDDFVSEESILTVNLVAQVAQQWVYFTQALNSRLNACGTKLSDNQVSELRKTLNRIKQGLPKEVSEDLGSDEQISNPGCYIATAVYGSYDCPEVWTLRRFRDYTLAETWYGRTFINIYYTISPTLVKWFGKSEWFRKSALLPLNKLIVYLHKKGIEDTPYNDRSF